MPSHVRVVLTTVGNMTSPFHAPVSPGYNDSNTVDVYFLSWDEGRCSWQQGPLLSSGTETQADSSSHLSLGALGVAGQSAGRERRVDERSWRVVGLA